MKKFPFVLLALLVMALVAMPVVASEPAGPPGVTVEKAVVFAFSEVPKEFNAIDLDAIAVFTSNEMVVGVERGFLAPVIGSADFCLAVDTFYNINLVTLAGLMYGDYFVNAAAVYLRSANRFEPLGLIA